MNDNTTNQKVISMEINDLLQQRESVHGKFGSFAIRMYRIRGLLPKPQMLPIGTHEACQMVVNKLCRAAGGDPYHLDHWVDIEGYATLALEFAGPGKSDMLERDGQVDAKRALITSILGVHNLPVVLKGIVWHMVELLCWLYVGRPTDHRELLHFIIEEAREAQRFVRNRQERQAKEATAGSSK